MSREASHPLNQGGAAGEMRKEEIDKKGVREVGARMW